MEDILEKASVTESMFTAWLVANSKYEEARELTYRQFVSKFVYEKKEELGNRGPYTYEDIRRVGDIQYDTFRDACFVMGFLEDDQEYIGAIREASEWGSGHILRKLFVVMLLSDAVNRPDHVWNETWTLLADGLLHEQRQLILYYLCAYEFPYVKVFGILIFIYQSNQANRRTLHDFKPIPYPDGYVLQQLGNRLIYDERSYDVSAMRTEFTRLSNALTDEQGKIFEKIMTAVHTQKGGVFFLHGYGGTGKTYMWRTLASALRSKHDICLTVATSGIASLLLPGGRTAHSKFKIPVPTMDNSTCKIDYDDEVADLLR
ncbi:uncharacterized protein LOC131619470 [Vicia villosa]|uniref:uncharacterized protein LOC131619470 n=1 Tax=Vicia villosa TaxID=3911 RepID=UPI00273CE46B|nr:uncharacterized protein LOC131619470 [Vicia villosa]